MGDPAATCLDISRTVLCRREIQVTMPLPSPLQASPRVCKKEEREGAGCWREWCCAAWDTRACCSVIQLVCLLPGTESFAGAARGGVLWFVTEVCSSSHVMQCVWLRRLSSAWWLPNSLSLAHFRSHHEKLAVPDGTASAGQNHDPLVSSEIQEGTREKAADEGGEFVCCKDKSKKDEDPAKAAVAALDELMSSGGACCGGSKKDEDNASCCGGKEKNTAKATDSGSCGGNNDEGGCCQDDSSKSEAATSQGGSCCQTQDSTASSTQDAGIGIKILYATTTGTSKDFATELAATAQAENVTAAAISLDSYDFEALQDETDVCVFILPTYEGGTPPPTAAWFYKQLDEGRNDFRIDSRLLKSVRFAVFGLGDSHYKEHFNTVATNVNTWLLELNAVQVLEPGCGNSNTAESEHKGQRADFDAWVGKFMVTLHEVAQHPERFVSAVPEEQVYESDSAPESDHEDDKNNSGVLDLEDLGGMVKKMNKAGTRRKQEISAAPEDRAEMVTPDLRSALGKQGYKIIGSHSGVKLCRWTKSMLRGRGGCYKHTFYGIESHRCMETTPSLACANKCVFCWRYVARIFDVTSSESLHGHAFREAGLFGSHDTMSFLVFQMAASKV